jgi:3-deoxy-7-phosphoheptulonate synthase
MRSSSWPGRARWRGREQIRLSAKQVAAAGAQFLRGGAFKPRSSPYSFQGMGVEGLKLMREAADETGLLVITEVMEISQIEAMLPYIDCFQVGARNMQNFNLLRELGHVRKPVLMKRGIAATIEEVLLSAGVHSERRQLRPDVVRARHSHL